LPYVAQSSVKYSRPAEPVAATKLATKNCAKGAKRTNPEGTFCRHLTAGGI